MIKRMKIADGHHAFIGTATRLLIDGQQYILLARNFDDLQSVSQRLLGCTLDPLKCIESAIVQRSTLDLIPTNTEGSKT